MKTLSWSAAVALLALVVCVPNAGAETVKCKKAIAKSSAAFAQAKVKALAKCNEGIVKTGVGTCPDLKATASITKAETKMRSTIDKTCGGADKLCGGNMGGEDTPASVGWPASCPNFEGGSCNNAITDCGDIADCLKCVNEAAVDQAIDLYYGDLALPSNGNKPLNSCQISIGKATAAFLGAKSKALQKCWDARLAGKHTDDCIVPATGDGKYGPAIAKADTKMRTTICKACGGTDKVCGGTADQTPTAIGFSATCPTVTIPGGSACGGPITDLQSLVDCVACVTEFKVDCTDRLQVPEFVTLPFECNPSVDPTPTPIPTCTAPPPAGPCPSVVEFTANGADADLDTGWTGLAHEATVPTNGRLTLSVGGCAGIAQPTCGQCNVTGILPNGGGPAFQTRRCTDQSWVQCSNNGDCITAGATGPCIDFFGAPLPLRAGGVSTCVVNRIAAPISGTINVDDGTSTTSVQLNSQVGTSSVEFHPCPVCAQGCNGGANTGAACTTASECPGGTCAPNVCRDGPRVGFVCGVNGTGVYGDVSLDCPPPNGSIVANLGINLNIATGTQTRTLTTANPFCSDPAFPGSRCHCDTCNNLTANSCQNNGDCPVSGGEAGICGARRCIGGPLAGEPCLHCMGGTNHGAKCTVASQCPGGACPTSCGVCNAGPSLGLPCNANNQCNACVGGSNPGAVCTNPSQCPGGTCTFGACEGNCNRPGGVETRPNGCNSGECLATADFHGECDAPVDQICSVQTFKTCGVDNDCNPPSAGGTCPECFAGQLCIVRNRPCFPGDGVLGSSVSVSGQADVPCGGVANPTVGSFFCVSPVGATAVNTASGLPGLGRVRLPGVVVVGP